MKKFFLLGALAMILASCASKDATVTVSDSDSVVVDSIVADSVVVDSVVVDSIAE